MQQYNKTYIYIAKKVSYVQSHQQLVRLNIRFRKILKFRKRYISANTSRYYIPNLHSLKRKRVIYELMISSKGAQCKSAFCVIGMNVSI